MSPHNERMQLRLNNSICTIDTKIGLIQELRLDGIDIFHSKNSEDLLTFENSIPLYGIPVLFPFSGRSWDENNQLGYWTNNEVNLKMPRHGFFHHLIEWYVKDSLTENSITLSGKPKKEASLYFPFNYEVTQSVTLDSKKFHYEIVISNKDETRPFPLYCGWHPFFLNHLPEIKKTLIHSAKNCVLVNADGNINECHQEILNSTKFPLNQKLNHVFLELRDNKFYIENFSANKTLTLHWNTNFKSKNECLVLWNNSKDQNYFCIEPWMAPPDALRNNQSFELRAKNHLHLELTIEF